MKKTNLFLLLLISTTCYVGSSFAMWRRIKNGKTFIGMVPVILVGNYLKSKAQENVYGEKLNIISLKKGVLVAKATKKES